MKDRVLQAERSSFETVTIAVPLKIIPPTRFINKKINMQGNVTSCKSFVKMMRFSLKNLDGNSF